MILNKQSFCDLSFVTVLYASTLYGFTNSILVFLLVIVAFSGRVWFSFKDRFFLFVLAFISIFSLLNNILVGLPSSVDSAQFYIPFFILSFLSAKFINNRILKIILIFVLVELVVAFIQNALGVSTFFRGNPNFYEFTSSNLYYRRSAGLSSSASVLAYKVMLSFVILYLVDIPVLYKRLIGFVLVAGLLVTFNRSAILASLCFYFIITCEDFIKGGRAKYKILFGVFVFTLILALTPLFEIVFEQFNRGKVDAVVDLSLRDVLWVEYLNFINEHYLFGYGSFKLLMEAPVQGYFGVKLHAHNSYIMFVASNGVLISAVFFVLILVNVNYSNFKLILPILIYSVSQYGILWGVSFMDILFLFFLTACNASSRFNLNKLRKS